MVQASNVMLLKLLSHVLWTPCSLFLKQPLMLSVYWYNYSLRTGLLVPILVNCTINCTGDKGGLIAFILVYTKCFS